MSGRLTLVLGGTRSGKSAHGLAVTRRLAGSGRAWFLATARAGDPELDERIRRHRRQRPADWPTIEVGTDLPGALAQTDADEPVLVEGLTLWLSALVGDEPADIDADPRWTARGALEAIDGSSGERRHRQRRDRSRARADARRRPILPRSRRPVPPADRGRRRRRRVRRRGPAASDQGPERSRDGNAVRRERILAPILASSARSTRTRWRRPGRGSTT